MAVFDDGSGLALYVGGAFTEAAGVSAKYIAKWDGTSWTPLGAGMSSTVFALAAFDDDGIGPNPTALYAAGDFTSAGGAAANRIAKWNGESWAPVGSGMNNTVYALTVFDADGDDPNLPALYAGGRFTSAGGVSAKRIANWNGTAWSSLGTGEANGTDDYVHTLAVFDADGDGPNLPALYAGGGFFVAGGESARRVAKWDGTAWSCLRAATNEADGVNSSVYKLIVFDDDGAGPHLPALYLGGYFTLAGSTSASRIVKWDGASWTPLGSGLGSSVQALGVFDADADGSGLSALYVGGEFTTAGGTSANRIARWDGSSWSSLGSGMDGGVYAMVAYDDDGAGPYLPALYVGGAFTTAGGVSSEHLGRWGCPLNNSPPVIAKQPASQTVCGGNSVTFSVSAWGTRPLTFQWRKDGEDIDLADGASYTVDAADPNDVGAYDVVVTNTFGSATSNAATLTLGLALSISAQPQSYEECAGGAIELTVVASGQPPLTYQWFQDDLIRIGYTSASYTIDPADATDSGVYTVRVSSGCGSMMSEPATVRIGSNPTITAQPESATVCEGGSNTFSVAAFGLPPFTYHWRKDGEPIPDANTAMYTISTAQLDDAGTYEVDVLDRCGAATSDSVTLTVEPKPVIDAQPQPQSACVGGAVTFSVTASGSEPLSYKWRKGGQEITGAIEATYSVDPVALADAGAYDVVVTNPCGSTTSTAAALTVYAGTLIQQHPQSQTVCAGGAVTLSVTADGLPPVTYEWQKDGQTIAEAIGPTLTINPVATSDAGQYDVIVTSGCGAVTSNVATLVVNVGPGIVEQPQARFVCPGGSATFAVTANGTMPLTYRWRKGTAELANGGNISGATTATLMINPAGAADAATDYNCVVTNSCGSATSENAALTVGSAAAITGQPGNQTLCSGGSASFAVTATGAPTPTYQWRKGTTSLTNGGNISGATTATLTIYPAGTGDAATNYNCVVTNSCGSATSNNATLTVNIGTSVTGQPGNQTVCSGGSASFAVTATGTPTPTYQWRKGTTSLTNGGNISGATSATLMINPAGTADAATNYNCVVTNSCGVTTTNNATLTVNAAAAIAGQPSNQTACPGGSASFTVSATGTPTPTFQWRKGTNNLSNGGHITGATTATLLISPADAGDVATNYNCVVTNSCGSATSNNAALAVNAGPMITGHPSNQSACPASGPVSFHVTATGSPAPTCRWRRGTTDLNDGGNLSGATTATLTINPVGAGDAATNYNCVVTNSCGSATSNNAALTLNAGPGITGHPVAQSFCTTGGSATFAVTATGSPAPSYQWRKGTTDLVDAGNISGATTATLTINPVGDGDVAANYNCVVTNTCGVATSNNAALTLNTGVVIREQPQSQSACAGTAVVLTVAAEGSGALTYRWRKDGQPIDGALDTTYRLDAITLQQAGQYDVVVTGTCGSATSAAATLQVTDCTPALGAPSAPDPTDGMTTAALDVALQWAAVAGASTYDVYFGPAATPPRLGTTTASRWDVKSLTAATKYYWRVVAKNETSSTDGPVWSFTTAADDDGTQNPPVDPNASGDTTQDGTDSNKPVPTDNVDNTDPNQAAQDSGDDPNDSALDQPVPPNCGAGTCGAGSAGLMPLTALCLGGIKLRRRQVNHAR